MLWTHYLLCWWMLISKLSSFLFDVKRSSCNTNVIKGLAFRVLRKTETDFLSEKYGFLRVKIQLNVWRGWHVLTARFHVMNPSVLTSVLVGQSHHFLWSWLRDELLSCLQLQFPVPDGQLSSTARPAVKKWLIKTVAQCSKSTASLWEYRTWTGRGNKEPRIVCRTDRKELRSVSEGGGHESVCLCNIILHNLDFPTPSD